MHQIEEPLKKVKITSSKKSLLAAACCILLLATVASIYTVYQQKLLYHFKPVDPGRLYSSGTLSWKGLEKAHRMVGIKTIINLRSESEMSEGSWYQMEKRFTIENRINLVNIPLRPDTPPRPDQIKQFLDVMTNPAMLPVLVHCGHGIIRAGMMVAVYKVAVLKQPNSMVLEDMPMFGHSLERRPAVKKFILSYSPTCDELSSLNRRKSSNLLFIPNCLQHDSKTITALLKIP